MHAVLPLPECAILFNRGRHRTGLTQYCLLIRAWSCLLCMQSARRRVTVWGGSRLHFSLRHPIGACSPRPDAWWVSDVTDMSLVCVSRDAGTASSCQRSRAAGRSPGACTSIVARRTNASILGAIEGSVRIMDSARGRSMFMSDKNKTVFLEPEFKSSRHSILAHCLRLSGISVTSPAPLSSCF